MKQGKTVLGDTIILRQNVVLIISENHFQTFTFPNKESALEYYKRKVVYKKRGAKPYMKHPQAVVSYWQLIVA